MIMIAVKHLDVYSGLCHSTREFTKLPRNVLPQSLRQDVSLYDYANARRFQRHTRSISVHKQKMRDTLRSHDPRASTLDAHSSAGQRLTHLGQCAWTIAQFNRKILHNSPTNICSDSSLYDNHLSRTNNSFIIESCLSNLISHVLRKP
jgi:hypothetical protein